MPPLLAAALVFTTSGSVLVLETIAGRLLAPYIGVTLETFTGIIGVVLAGIAVGTWLGGRLADRLDPRQLLGPTVVLGGGLAIAAVPLVRLFGAAGLGSGPPAIVFLATVAFFLPSAVLSAVSPTVVKLQLQTLDETGRVVGRLSAIGTAGSLVGTFVTGFLLVAELPSTPIVLGLGGLLVVAGLALWVWLRTDGSHRDMVLSGLVVAFLGAAGGLAIASPCDVETAYFCARVEVDPARPGGRLLILDQLRHSYVDLDDPTHLEFTYAQIMGDVLDSIGDDEHAPLDALHIGGGGFTLPRYLAATRPGTDSLVLEIDPAMVELAQAELGLELADDLRAVTGDARVNLRREPDDAYDLVIGDAFGGQAVPWHLATRELTEEVARVLRPGGLYAINLIDYGPLAFARAELATIAAVFDHVAVIGPPARLAGRDGGNLVMLGSDAPLPLEEIQRRNDERGDDDVVVGDPAGVAAFIGDARVLTDEHAPVDQLLTPET